MDSRDDVAHGGRGRTPAAPPADLRRLFHPETVAVVGASDTPGRPTTLNWGIVRRWADRQGAVVHPVNPGRETVDGLRCYPSLHDLPGPVDVVILLIADVTSGLRDSVACDAGFVVVFAAGFAELGAEGAAAQEELRALIAGSRTRMLGPNTNMNAFEEHRTDLAGPAIALISQSGHQGRPVFMLQDNGVRVSRWAPTGNEADLELADFVVHFAGDPDVGVIAAYIEGFRDGPRFMAAAERCEELDTPLVLVKVGRSETGQASATSHTGKLSGSDQVADGVFRQLGVTRVDTLDQLGDTATLLARAGRPRATGVAVYSISGGTGAHVADLCAAAGLHLPTFSAQRQRQLHQWIPPYLQVANPVDCGGHPVGDERGRQILDAIVSDPAVGLLLVPIMAPFPPLSDRLVADLVDVAEQGDVPVCVVWGSPVGTEPALRDVLFGSERIVVFRSAGNAVEAISAWFRWAEHRGRDRDDPVPPPPGAAGRLAAAREILSGPEPSLSEHRSKALLDLYGVALAREELVTTEAGAVEAAERLGYPVVLKAASAVLTHKSELGLVATGVERDAVGETYRRLAAGAERAAPGRVDGVLVCEQVDGGVELVLGLSQDRTFGPTVLLGRGGVLVEVQPDVAFRVPPFGRAEARRMVDELACRPLLDGVRGAAPADIEALLDAIVAVQRMAVELEGHLGELDVNPLVVREAGRGVVALDALATRAPR